MLSIVLLVALVAITFLGYLPETAQEISESESQLYWSAHASPLRITSAAGGRGTFCGLSNGTGFVFSIENAGTGPITITGVNVGNASYLFCESGSPVPSGGVLLQSADSRELSVYSSGGPACPPGGSKSLNLSFSYDAQFPGQVQDGTKNLVVRCSESVGGQPGASSQQLWISTNSLPGGTCDYDYPGTQLEARWQSGSLASAVWNAQNLPSGLFLSSSGFLSGIPCEQGSFNPAFTATSVGFVAHSNLGLEVVPSETGCSCGDEPAANDTLQITTGLLPDAQAGVPYGQLFSATGGASPYTWSILTGQLPEGLVIYSNAIYGVPATPGTYYFALQVKDAAGQSASHEYSIKVLPPPDPLEITTPFLQDAFINQTYPYDYLEGLLEAAGGNGYYDWSVASGALPPGLSIRRLDAFTPNKFDIHGVPTALGAYPVTLRVTDGLGASDERDFVLSVYEIWESESLHVTPDSLPDGAVGSYYQTELYVAGGSGPYTWSVISGALPPNITLIDYFVSGGAILSVPEGPPSAGTFNFTLRVNNSAGAYGTKNYSLTIHP